MLVCLQVNGAFELSSNRRNIWWADSHGAGADRSAWNLALLKVIIGHPLEPCQYHHHTREQKLVQMFYPMPKSQSATVILLVTSVVCVAFSYIRFPLYPQVQAQEIASCDNLH